MDDLVVTDPATGDVVGRLPCSEPTGWCGRHVVPTRPWARTSPVARAAALKAGVARLRAAADEIAVLHP